MNKKEQHKKDTNISKNSENTDITLEKAKPDYNEDLSRMVSVLSHEIKNPLTSIDIQVQLLHERLDSIKEKDHKDKLINSIQLISHEIRRLVIILDELLSFSRPPQLEFQSCDFRTILNEFKDFVSPNAKERNIDIQIRQSKQFPNIECDPFKIRQVLLNLVLNAFQAINDSGSIFINADIDDKGKMLICDICDTGCGISKENIDDVFKPFFTLRSGGTGLGLSIANQIIKEHNGNISILKSSELGTSIRIKLPLRRIKANTHHDQQINSGY